MEWTPEHIKVFYFPQDEIPRDLSAEVPDPDSWDDYITGYFPFGASERANPGSCSDYTRLLEPQTLVGVFKALPPELSLDLGSWE